MMMEQKVLVYRRRENRTAEKRRAKGSMKGEITVKLIIAIVQDEDASRLIGNLMNDGFSVTKLATTGGFLKSGNTTILAGVEDSRVQDCLGIIEKVCKSRKQIATSPVTMGGASGMYASYPIEVTVGGATVFILAVDQFVKY